MLVPKQHKIQQRVKKIIYTNTTMVKIIKRTYHHNGIPNNARLRECARMFRKNHQNHESKFFRLRSITSYEWEFTTLHDPSQFKCFTQGMIFQCYHFHSFAHWMPQLNFVLHPIFHKKISHKSMNLRVF